MATLQLPEVTIGTSPIGGTSISYTDGAGALRVITFDATLRTGHQFSSKATEHPLDSRAVMSDHVIVNPRRVTIEAEVTNTPLYAPEGKTATPERIQLDSQYLDLRKGARVTGGPGRNVGFSVIQVEVGGSEIKVEPAEWAPVTQSIQQTVDSYEEFDRVREVLDALDEIIQTRTVVTVSSALKTYQTCVLENLSAPETVEDAIVFSLDLVEISTVDTQLVALDPPVKELRAKPKKSSGSKAGYELPAEKETTMKVLTEGLARLLNGGGFDFL